METLDAGQEVSLPRNGTFNLGGELTGWSLGMLAFGDSHLRTKTQRRRSFAAYSRMAK